MRESSLALYNLGVGQTAVQLFIAKNPIFFDSSYNPTLDRNKLPTVKGNSIGYSLANEFAEYMDLIISSSKDQINIISKVFVPELGSMTTFVNKVFDESIGDYLECVLRVAKERETSIVYLHTLASAVYCCTQFLDFLKGNGKVEVDTSTIKAGVIKILKPYCEKYIALEVDIMSKKLTAEVQVWDKSVHLMLHFNLSFRKQKQYLQL